MEPLSYPAGRIQVKLTTLSIGDISCCGINDVAVSCVGNKCCAKAKIGNCLTSDDCCDSTHICHGTPDGICCAEEGGACSTIEDGGHPNGDCCDSSHDCVGGVCTDPGE